MIKADDWMGAMLPLLKEGKSLKIKTEGGSMVPFIVGGRDTVEISAPKPGLKRGDIVLIRRDSGKYVLHRMYKVKSDGYYILGDGEDFVEGPFTGDQIIAQCRYYYKKGKRKDNEALDMKIKYTIWFWLKPFRLKLIKLNNLKRKLLGKGESE